MALDSNENELNFKFQLNEPSELTFQKQTIIQYLQRKSKSHSKSGTINILYMFNIVTLKLQMTNLELIHVPRPNEYHTYVYIER